MGVFFEMWISDVSAVQLLDFKTLQQKNKMWWTCMWLASQQRHLIVSILTCLLLNGSTVMVSAPMSMILPRVNPSIGCGTHTFLPSSILQVYCVTCTCFPTCKYNEWITLAVVLNIKAAMYWWLLPDYARFCTDKFQDLLSTSQV